MPAVIIERDVSIPMDDGLSLRADVFRPDDQMPVPVVMTLGPYGKGARYQDFYAEEWDWLLKAHPDILAGSSRQFLTWETVDPEIWVPWGYAVVRVDSRGAGRSPGFLDPFSPREVRDYYEAIEWAAGQSWSDEKVGLCGISYYAINQWLVASMGPPHLIAMIPWEGAADAYRDQTRHGGILSNFFLDAWFARGVRPIQHGNPGAPIDPWLDERVTGPAELDDQQLASNRSEPKARAAEAPLDNEYYRERSADWSRISTPFLSAANWGGDGLHKRGNFEAFTQAAATQKWLEVHPGRHEEWFYTQYGLDVQKRFLDHFLKGADNGWDRQPPVHLNIRRPFANEYDLRPENEWPLARTRWTALYLDAESLTLEWENPARDASTSFSALGEPVTLLSAPIDEETEITGPLAARLFVSSSTEDADLFATLRAFSPTGEEVTFQGAIDPHAPLAQGWLRASHRKLDPVASLPYRPYHTHDEIERLEPGSVYELDIEIWPTCIVLPPRFRLGLTLGGRDFARIPDAGLSGPPILLGSGLFLHVDAEDRPPALFGGTTTIHTGPQAPSHLLVPIIPDAELRNYA